MSATSVPDQYKVHESSSDRTRQRAILQAFCNAIDCAAKMTSTLTEYDAELFDPKKLTEPMGVAEVKYRNNAFNAYPDYQIDAMKINALMRAAKVMGVRAVLIVSWMGDIRYCGLTDMAQKWDGASDLFPTTLTKRRDREEYADRQYHIPLTLFKKAQK